METLIDLNKHGSCNHEHNHYHGPEYLIEVKDAITKHKQRLRIARYAIAGFSTEESRYLQASQFVNNIFPDLDNFEMKIMRGDSAQVNGHQIMNSNFGLKYKILDYKFY